eukprot:GHVS01069607.1.p1 GENE.GHVS01069607.1~~GHVS01069607.1.p1  ORF type:complete len:497 (+),score=78.88 GHVS01069607.1:1470-2960(+)
MSQYTMFSLPTWDFNEFTDKAKLINATGGLAHFDGPSDNGQAIVFQREQVFGEGNSQKRADAQDVMIMVTTGQRTGNDLVVEEAKKFKDDMGILVAVGLGQNVNENTIRKVASRRKTFTNRNYSNIGQFAQNIVNSILPPLADYCVTTTTAGTATTTTQPAITTLPPAPTTTTTAAQTTTTISTPCTTIIMDVGIVLDSSNNIDAVNFKTSVLPFLTRLEAGLNVRPRGTHVAAVQYAGRPKLEFKFLDNVHLGPLQAATVALRHMGGEKSQLAQAISFAMKGTFCGEDVNEDVTEGTSSTSSKFKSSESSSDEGSAMVGVSNAQCRRFVPRVMLIVTDGNFTGRDPTQKAISFKANGGTIVAIGVGPNVKVRVINNLATPGLSFVADYNNMDAAKVDFILKEILSQKPNCNNTTCTSTKMDIGFVVDSSANFSEKQFTAQLLPFVQKLEGRLFLGAGNSHVSIVQFGGDGAKRVVNYLEYPETRALQRRTGMLDH